MKHTNLCNAYFCKTCLIDAVLDDSKLTGARLWESQRDNWSIKRVACDSAYRDRAGVKEDFYQSGEFEKLFSKRCRIIMEYPDGLVPVDSLASFIQRLEHAHHHALIRIKSIDFNGEVPTVTLSVGLGLEIETDQAEMRMQELHNQLEAALREATEQRNICKQLQEDYGQLQRDLWPIILERCKQFQGRETGQSESLTVMFLDLKGFSCLRDVEICNVIALSHRVSDAILECGKAKYTNSWGDAIKAAFESPNDAIQRACLLIRALKAVDLDARIGMHYGQTSLQYDPVRQCRDVYGASVNEAARLEPMAEPCEVLVSKELRYHPNIQHEKFSFRRVFRQLKKPFGDHKLGESLECYAVELK